MKQLTTFLLAGILLSGCTLVREKHFFKEGDNYYRLRIRATSFASKTRYISGYFSEHALNNYFGDLSKADSVKLIVPGETQTRSSGNKLVMVMSTNSNAVTGQINAMAESQEMFELIARLSNKDKIDAVKRNDMVASGLKAGNQAAEEAGSVYLTTAFSDTSLLDYLNYLAQLQGKGEIFRDTTDVKRWLNTNRKP